VQSEEIRTITTPVVTLTSLHLYSVAGWRIVEVKGVTRALLWTEKGHDVATWILPHLHHHRITVSVTVLVVFPLPHPCLEVDGATWTAHPAEREGVETWTGMLDV
jgi:hypothetical protein